MGKNLLAQAARRPLAALFLVCFIAWLPGFFTLPPLDRDESRFAQATKQMLETGDFVDIRLGDAVRYNKPAGIYWLQAASTAVFGEDGRNQIWTYRIPSLIGAFAAVALCFWMARAFAGAETAFMAALLLGMTVLLASEAKIAKTDAVLLATVLGTQCLLIRAYLSARDPARPPPSLALALGGWAAFGVGVLIKGPIILLVCLAGILAVSLWDRDWRWLARTKPLPGFAVALLIMLPWAIAIGLESHGQFYEQSLGQDFGTKLISGQETHGQPPGYYTALVSFSFWPATLLLIPGVVSAIRRRQEPAMRYLLAWAAAAWLMFEAAPTKLPHYVLPVYPALACLAALWLLREDKGTQPKSERIAWSVSLGLFVLVGLFYAALLALAPSYFGDGGVWWLYAGAGVGAAAVLAAAVLALRGDRLKATFMGILAVLILYPLAAFGTAPRVQKIWLSPRLYEAVQRNQLPADPPPVLAGYTEPSLVFLLGTPTRVADAKNAAEIAAIQGGLALVDQRRQALFLAGLAARAAVAQPLEEITGIDYSRGRADEVTLYRVTPGSAPH